MRHGILMDGDQLSEVQRSVRDTFTVGGSFLDVLIVLAGMIGLVLLTYLLTIRQSNRKQRRTRADPWQLFRHLAAKMNLSSAQIRFLDGAVTHAGLRNPAVIFISRARYDACLADYCDSKTQTGSDPNEASVMTSEIRSLLF